MSFLFSGRHFGGQDGFTPADLSGLVLWLDSDAITGKTDGNTITSWTDQSSSGNDAAEATNPPTYDDGSTFAEGIAGVKFDTTTERLDIPADASLANAAATYIVVGRLLQINIDRTASDSCWWLNKKNTNPATMALQICEEGFRGIYRLDGTEGTANQLDNEAFVDQSVNTHVLRVDSSNAIYDIWSGERESLNRVASVATAAAIDTDNNGILSIGNHPTANNLINVPRIIYDVLAFDRVLTDNEVLRLCTFLSTKHRPRWQMLGQVFSTQYKSINIFVDGTTAYLTYSASGDLSIGYMTADLSADPHDWTDQGAIFTPATACRTARLVKHSTTWYLYYDDRTNGQLRVATGSTPETLSDYGSNPILSGSGTDWEQYVRHPFVLVPAETHDAGWHMLYDGRKTNATSGVGAVGHATSSDGLSWTRDSGNNPVVSASGVADFEENDCGEPRAIYDDAASEYRVFWGGYSEDWTWFGNNYPHHLGQGKSATLASVTRSAPNPILPLDPDDNSYESTAHVSPCPYYAGGSKLHLYFAGFTAPAQYRIARARERDS